MKFARIIAKRVLPSRLWNKLRLMKEGRTNRNIAREYLGQISASGAPVVTQMDAHIISAMSQFRVENVLEVGTGGGRLTYWLARQGWKVTGVEPDHWYRDLVSKFLQRHSLVNTNICDGDVQALRFDDMQFDVVLCNAVIEHVQNPEAAISELVRCSRIACIITTPYGYEADSPDHKQHFFEMEIERLTSAYKAEKIVVYDRPGGNRTWLITIRRSP